MIVGTERDPSVTAPHEAAALWSALGELQRAWAHRQSCATCIRLEHEEHNAAAVWKEAATDLVSTLVVVDGQVRRDPKASVHELLLRSITGLTRTWRLYARSLEAAAEANDRCRAQVLKTASDELESVGGPRDS
jgi:hypothetical protein